MGQVNRRLYCYDGSCISLLPMTIQLTAKPALILLVICLTGIITLPSVPQRMVPAIRRYDRFREISPSDIKPDGWLREFLLRQQSGLTGHSAAQGYPFTINFWGGETDPKNVPKHNRWAPYEQTGYQMDGMLRLGLLLDDQQMIGKYADDLNWVINHPVKGGQLGPSLRVDRSEWPMAVFFKSVIAYQLARNDPKVTDAFKRHYLETPLSQLSSGRDICNVEGLLRTYEWTGDTFLLSKAKEAYQRFCSRSSSDLTLSKLSSGDKVVMHGVTFCEELKLPVLLYIYTGNQKYLAAATNGLQTMIQDHLLMDGVPSSNEFLATRDPLQSHETCDISDFTYSLGYFLMATGDARYADMIERAIFNAGCGAISKDFKGFQYYSTVNQVIADGGSDQNAFWRGGNDVREAYCPNSEPPCCAGNVHRFMPDYAARMWMTGGRGEVVASLYGPSHITISAGVEHNPVTITEKTAYPFDETIEFEFAMETKTTIPFTLRIPGWCSSPGLKINGKSYRGNLKPGTYVTIDRTFQNGDTVQVSLPMPVRLIRFADAIGVERGPILYAYPVPETVTVNQAHTKVSDFPALELHPNGPWNYALDVNESNVEDQVRVIKRNTDGYPLDPDQAPVCLKVPVRRVKGWTLDGGLKTPPLPIAYELGAQTEWITLVPYGATRLRMAAFPEAITRVSVPVQNFQVAGPYPYDRNMPIAKQVYPPDQSDAPALWEEARLRPDGILDLKAQFPDTGNRSLAYVRAVIYTDESTSAILAINAKDACEVRLNGTVIHYIGQPNQLEYQFPDWIPVTLQKGANQVQLKVGEYGGHIDQYLDGWGVEIRCAR